MKVEGASALVHQDEGSGSLNGQRAKHGSAKSPLRPPREGFILTKVQCPYKTRKYRCEYGKICTEDMEKNNGMPSYWNECPVAQRQLNRNPWRTERQPLETKETKEASYP